MSLHDCPCCACDDEEEVQRTPEELAALKAAADARLADRMRPARDAGEQMARDLERVGETLEAAMARALYDSGPPFEGSQVTGLSAWLSREAA